MKLVKEDEDGSKTIKFSADEFFHLSMVVSGSDYGDLGEKQANYLDMLCKGVCKIAENMKFGG